ncbi:protein translocase subunit SecD [Candidatus Dependentiae bacterium]|nr:protein translocase subunit SecD [Candidatus Dependentiae bacterium]MCC7415049.1 protein translocase subunit SecD [Campylobacterota bacterium]
MSVALRRIAFSSFTPWIVLAIVSCYLLFPLRQKLRFGIDLVGGTYITLGVQTNKAVEAQMRSKLDLILIELRSTNKQLPTSYDVKDGSIELIFASNDDAQVAASAIRDSAYTQDVHSTTVRMQPTAAAIKQIETDAVARNIEVLRARLDGLSVAEISIAAHGDRNIVIELPDVSDPQKAKAMIGTAAVLEFKLVEKMGKSAEDILYEYDGVLPNGMEILSGRGDHAGEKIYYLVPKSADVSGKDLRDASAVIDQEHAQWIVSFVLSEQGGRKFHAITSNNYRKQLAIVLDDVIISAPVIQDEIKDRGQISGNFTKDSAKELAVLLRSGAFVAPVTFEEERQVGPSLGAESIRQGLLSCIIGLTLVFFFALYYYSVSGLLAFIALLYNVLLILLGLSWMQATLTLPGIAGIVLTIGMAIDASILIFERIKEELAAGINVRKAVSDGFADAMRVILDSNFTTFIVGLVLYTFGTGPIGGFAITLMLGIVATLISGLFFLRSLFNLFLDVFNIQKLRI